MAVSYDSFYQTENLFGDPYPELIDFFTTYPRKGKVLDLGCGQGRDAIPLARLGYEVMGVDHSKVGIDQMSQIAKTENLPLIGWVADVYEFDDFANFDFVLLDSMFHFTKNDLQKETDLIKKIISKVDHDCLIVFCIQDTGKKVTILNEILNFEHQLHRLIDQKLEYIFEDPTTGHQSKTTYRMIIVQQ